ncbi:MAG TPA: ABC transporter permease [Steroidobacteraceae bacterium]|jgi:putative ABC transport system permease protein|nr:ABC transporter permease [Steroidobacteraceae bacterium]
MIIFALLLLLALWLGLTRVGRQSWSVTQVGILTIPERLGSSLVVVVGIAGVVGVLVAVLAMGAGFEATLKQTGTDDTAIVMRAGAQTELNSVLDRDSATLISQMPQVLRNAEGLPIASSEIVVVTSLPKKSTGLDSNVELRGVGVRAWELRPEVKITAGRKFQPGLRELAVGKGARGQFANLDLGSSINLNGQRWSVVGAFESGDSYDSEIWGDAAIVGPAYRRGSSSTSVTVRLTEPSALDAFQAALAADPRLKVDARTTRAYYSDQSAKLSSFIRKLGITIGSIMALGAVFGALNTMYAAVSARTREIATLRAIGFRGAPVIVSVLLETMLLALLGGLIGAGLAWSIFDHYTASTLGANFSQVVFAFEVSPALLWTGLQWALAIGFIGGLFPALRAARMPVTDGLREL